MTATATRTITLDLPETLIEGLNEIADFQHQPLESIVSDILETLLPALKQRAKAHYDAEWEQKKTEMFRLNAEQLNASVRAEMEPQDKARMVELLDFNRERSLTPQERAEMDTLQDKADKVAMTRVAALIALQSRKDAGEACS